jgi:hypothetical protein
MTIYGYTVVNTDNYPESRTFLFSNKQKCIDDAYECYVNDWKACEEDYGFEDGLDDFGNPMMTKEEFIEDFTEMTEALIQNPHSHISYDYFCKEVE